MKHIQACIDRGWVLEVRKDTDASLGLYIAMVNDPNPKMDVTSGHAHIGRTVETALLQLDDYIASQGKEVKP